jgi:biotin carboxylase
LTSQPKSQPPQKTLPENHEETMAENILVIASYLKGERFMRRAASLGANVYLLTVEKLLQDPWPRDVIKDVYAQAAGSTLAQTIRTVSYLARHVHFDQIIPMDDFDVETAAALREHFRLPGMGDTVARFFRDKLAMRVKARELGLLVPDFVQVCNHDDIAAFAERVAPPWMYKPRSQAGATGIIKVTRKDQLWQLVEQQGDLASFHLLEAYAAGDVCHVDSLVNDGKVIFVETHRCGAPPFDVAHGGGVFTSTTIERGSPDDRALKEMNAKLLAGFQLDHGAAHVEFIRARGGPNDGQFYFLECGARVGGAHIAEMVEASTGINLWEEWASLELQRSKYRLPTLRTDYGGLAITLARQERPDSSAYDDPEIFYRATEKNHIGLVVRAVDERRARDLITRYTERFRDDFCAVLPAATSPEH